MHLGHFSAMLLCAVLISVVLAVLSKPTKQRFTWAIRYFVLFIVISVALAWLMYPFSH